MSDAPKTLIERLRAVDAGGFYNRTIDEAVERIGAPGSGLSTPVYQIFPVARTLRVA